MIETNLTLLPADELPVTDEAKPKLKVNNLQENFIFLLNKKKVELAEVKKATSIPWGTLYAWYKGDVGAQMLDINVKELADYFEVSVDELAFGEFGN